ncbi:hypothetical protein Dred_0968 [Desulforamulus reducens MI-1]|uniref:Uncharacterized protein n=1 Tax=Desulforamulus reducens (strain ATCC BAA-1160 / DSM 100696 / MI-1) TaxID=349161 RepID=A4J350_DESRM|nr:hypothetical protein [Desulforamulus reducens]ABO49503.1 hypothetical protein Dred_0968 [Desulforamulus reducens MI-1]
MFGNIKTIIVSIILCILILPNISYGYTVDNTQIQTTPEYWLDAPEYGQTNSEKYVTLTPPFQGAQIYYLKVSCRDYGPFDLKLYNNNIWQSYSVTNAGVTAKEFSVTPYDNITQVYVKNKESWAANLYTVTVGWGKFSMDFTEMSNMNNNVISAKNSADAANVNAWNAWNALANGPWSNGKSLSATHDRAWEASANSWYSGAYGGGSESVANVAGYIRILQDLLLN